jgi:hypothetical protein
VIVHHNVGEIQIPSDRMRHVAASDRKAVAIASGDQHHQIRIRHLDPLRNRQGASVRC